MKKDGINNEEETTYIKNEENIDVKETKLKFVIN